MGLVVALAVASLSMTVDEALWSATRGGALALRRPDLGQLGMGARGDLVVLDAPRAAHLAYRPGIDLPVLVVRGGETVVVGGGPGRVGLARPRRHRVTPRAGSEPPAT